MTAPLDALPLEVLRTRTSSKWSIYPDDVLPLFVAETDFALAEPISRALHAAVERGDTGYTPPRNPLPAEFAAFAERRFGWRVDPSHVRLTCDVMMAVAELLRSVTEPGDQVIVTPPVYPPFFAVQEESRTHAVSVPLLERADGFALDLDGIEQAFTAGAKAILLCNPHNPTGTTHTRDSLAALAEIVERHGGWVISDEIHAPTVYPGSGYTPFLDVSDAARTVGFTATSASKAFNLAGLKAAVMVTAASAPRKIVAAIPLEVEWRAGLFGVIAGVAAFRDSELWLDALIARLQLNQQLVRTLLAEHLPGARYRPGDAGFLAWVDARELGWGDLPSAHILKGARVAVNSGREFGAGGLGHFRINYGTSPEILTEAIERIGSLVER